MLALTRWQIRSGQQALMHADGALHFATTSKQVTEGEVQFCCLWIKLGDLDKCIDGTIRLFIEQKIQAFKVRVWQASRLTEHVTKVKPGSQPTQAKEQWQEY
jgi:hypothetical protein